MNITIVSLIMFVIYIALPIFLIFRVWKNSSSDLLKWLISTIGNFGYILCLFFIGGWPMILTGYYTRYILLAAMLVAVVKSYRNQKKCLPKITRRYFITAFITGLVSLLPIGIIVAVLASPFGVPEAIHLDFPLKNGKYYILHGGNSAFINHHRPVNAQKYAIDIIKLNRFGIRCSSLNAKSLSDYNVYDDVIYSPCDGEVVEIVDGQPDLELGKMDPENPGGNYLAIEMASPQMTVFLAHIQKGSFLVKRGDVVARGQPLCRIGNSGNTTEPHLHIHVIKTGGDLLFEGEGVPMKFQNRFLIRNDRVSSHLRSEE